MPAEIADEISSHAILFRSTSQRRECRCTTVSPYGRFHVAGRLALSDVLHRSAAVQFERLRSHRRLL